MSDRMPERMSEYMPKVCRTDARKNVRNYVKIVFQGGDRSKKAIVLFLAVLKHRGKSPKVVAYKIMFCIQKLQPMGYTYNIL